MPRDSAVTKATSASMSDLRSLPAPNGCFVASSNVMPCSVIHAVHEARLEVHHAVGVGEVARQLRVGALHHARPEPEVALLERDVLRARGLLPQALAARFPQLGGVAVLQRLAVLLDFLLGVLPEDQRRREAPPPAQPPPRPRCVYPRSSSDASGAELRARQCGTLPSDAVMGAGRRSLPWTAARHLGDAGGNERGLRDDLLRVDVVPLQRELADAELDALRLQLLHGRVERGCRSRPARRPAGS